MKKTKLNLSIQKIMSLIFIVALLISVSLSSVVIFTNWIASAQKEAERITKKEGGKS